MTTVVILQPQFLPWAGVFEQMRCTDVFVHLDDVQLPQGRSFCSRVQVKTYHGRRWQTAPVNRHTRQSIRDVRFDNRKLWREQHVRTWQQNFAGCPHEREVGELVDRLYAHPTDSLADFNIRALELIAERLGLSCQFRRASEFPSTARATDRLLEIVQHVGASTYLTGHGGWNYLDHERFDECEVEVKYMIYRVGPYPQPFGAFTPFVSVLDLIANTGPQAPEYLNSDSVSWRDFAACERGVA